MHRRSLIAVFAVLVSLAAARAEALSVRDVIELSKAGLGDSVLLALIDVDRSLFSIDIATLKQLKAAGVSDAVIVAMIHSGRDVRPAEPPQPANVEPPLAPEPQDAAPPAPQPAPAPYPVAVPVPVYIAVPTALPRGGDRRPVRQAAPRDVPPNCLTAQVPFWGFGGKTQPQPTNVCR